MRDLLHYYFRIFTFLITTIFLFVGCGQSNDDLDDPQSLGRSQQTLYYFTWSDYADTALLTDFEKRTGTRVVVDTFSSNEELLAKVQSGAAGYDVVVPSDFMAGVMAKLGLLAELDLQRIPNVKLVEEHLQGLSLIHINNLPYPIYGGRLGSGTTPRYFPTPLIAGRSCGIHDIADALVC